MPLFKLTLFKTAAVPSTIAAKFHHYLLLMTPIVLSSAPTSANVSPTIGIIGGGIAGATIALRLSELGIKVNLIEQGPTLVNGPPICHLHAGGNLYREISDQQCITLLTQSIEVLRLYNKSVDYRPTVIAIPCHDQGEPEDLLPRLNTLQQQYQQLIDQDPKNKVLGPAENYYQSFSRQQLEQLAEQPEPSMPSEMAQWIIPFAKRADLSQLKFPIIVVQEFGLSVFRLAATASLALESIEHCQILTDTKVVAIDRCHSSSKSISKWQITLESSPDQSQRPPLLVDYIINACGFKTGSIDDLVDEKRQRMVEFKAAYVTHWQQTDAMWPEVIFFGDRGTPNGMAQLTPYPGGYFQIHGMTQDITLFDQGLVMSETDSAQPKLPAKFIAKITKQWPEDVAQLRTQKSINYMAKFIPDFSTASVGGKPLFGAQQIPGDQADLRTADVTFGQFRYARCEIVKASSVLTSADAILTQLIELKIIKQPKQQQHYFPTTDALTDQQITARAIKLAEQRNYPAALAQRNSPHLIK